VALQLRKLGIRPVRPLLGGFYEWKNLGFPLTNPLEDDGEPARKIGSSWAEAPEG
jgi:3-mercaptopyruvate sulfurtransferase SseA